MDDEQSELESPSFSQNGEETLDAQEEQLASSETEESEEEEEEEEESVEAEDRQHCQQQRQVSDNFKSVRLLSENAREFKKFRLIGREASFAFGA